MHCKCKYIHASTKIFSFIWSWNEQKKTIFENQYNCIFQWNKCWLYSHNDCGYFCFFVSSGFVFSYMWGIWWWASMVELTSHAMKLEFGTNIHTLNARTHRALRKSTMYAYEWRSKKMNRHKNNRRKKEKKQENMTVP